MTGKVTQPSDSWLSETMNHDARQEPLPMSLCDMPILKEANPMMKAVNSELNKVLHEGFPSTVSGQELRVSAHCSIPTMLCLCFQDLLQLQYEGVAVMPMFDKAKINVNLLIFLLNKKFYGK